MPTKGNPRSVTRDSLEGVAHDAVESPPEGDLMRNSDQGSQYAGVDLQNSRKEWPSKYSLWLISGLSEKENRYCEPRYILLGNETAK